MRSTRSPRVTARAVSVFGSVARGDDRPDSDIDFLVEFEAEASLLDLMAIQDDLEALLNCSVDVVSLGGLKERDEHIRLRGDGSTPTGVLTRAAERLLEIIGEAADNISREATARHPDVDWVLTYHRSDPNLIWQYVTAHAPTVAAALRG